MKRNWKQKDIILFVRKTEMRKKATQKYEWI